MPNMIPHVPLGIGDFAMTGLPHGPIRSHRAPARRQRVTSWQT
jgi:hypothetical protein